MAGPFEERYPNIAGWVKDGWIEIGRDNHGRFFVRVLDVGGLVREGKEHYETVDEALVEAAVSRIDGAVRPS